MVGKDGQTIESQTNKKAFISAANFVIEKALSRLNVFETEARILNEHLAELEKDYKLKKVSHFINNRIS